MFPVRLNSKVLTQRNGDTLAVAVQSIVCITSLKIIENATALLKVEGSNPVRGNCFAVFFCFNTILADLTE